MKIAISAQSPDPDQPFSARFGRCQYFLVSESQNEDWDRYPNPARDSQGGAGTQVAGFLADHGIEAVVSGRFGPNAFEALQLAGIQAYLASSGTPRELADQCRSGTLKLALEPAGSGHHGGSRRGRRW